MSELAVNNVSMRYILPQGGGVQALKDVSFTLKKGELLTVLGPSGCGKTTLLNILAGFLAPTEGEISLDNVPISGPSSDRLMLFQDGALFEWFSVKKNISFGPDMMGEPKHETEQKVNQLLDIVGLQGFGDKMVYELSGGMQQRVAFARSLANDPKLLLMDEPLGALDALTRQKMQGLILKLWKETGKTIILITHSVEEALYLGERLFVMEPRPGRLLKEYNLPFAEQALTENPRDIKASKEFIDTREEVLGMIWEMEEEIMGRQEENL